MQKERILIYLAGNITKHLLDNTQKEVEEWRDYVRKKLKAEAEFLVPNITVNVNADPSHYVFSDAWAVENCDLIFCRLTDYSIGSLIEIGWAYWKPKPIILVCDKPEIINHGFLKIRATIFSTIDNAIEYIKKEFVARE